MKWLTASVLLTVLILLFGNWLDRWLAMQEATSTPDRATAAMLVDLLEQAHKESMR